VGGGVCTPLVMLSGQWASPLGPWGQAEGALLLSSVLHAMLYATYVGLAARAGAVFATQTSYIVTASGLCWSMLLLGERFSQWIWVALAVRLVGLSLVQPRARGARA